MMRGSSLAENDSTARIRCSCSPADKCYEPKFHFWWSDGDCSASWPPHLIELRQSYDCGLWLDLDVSGKVWLRRITREGWGDSAKYPKESKLVQRIQCNLEVGKGPNLVLFHTSEDEPSEVSLSSSVQLLPVIQALRRLREAQVQMQCAAEDELALELPLQLCEGRACVHDFAPWWRIWTEYDSNGHVVLAAKGNGWGPRGKSWSGKVVPVKALHFDAIGPALVLQGLQVGNVLDNEVFSVHEQATPCKALNDSPNSSVLRLALPQDAVEAARLLDNVRLVAAAACVATEEIPPSIEMPLPSASLTALRQGDDHAVHILSDGLFRRGFCFIDVDDALKHLGESALQEAELFLSSKSPIANHPPFHTNWSISDAVKDGLNADVETYPSTEAEGSDVDQSHSGCSTFGESADGNDLSDLHLVGHFVDRWKSGVRFLTGDLLDDPKQKQGLPSSFSSKLTTVAKELDVAATDVLHHCLHIFSPSSKSASSMCTAKGLSLLYDHDLAVVEKNRRKIARTEARNFIEKFFSNEEEDSNGGDSSESSSSLNATYPKYGIVDCVYYSMERGCPELVVGAHIDPGLFVLALPQKGIGLQLCDEHGTWMDIPDGKGVIWAGAAAMCSSLKGGAHRVVCRHGTSVPRLALWHEVCTYGQLVPPVLDLLEKKGLELRMGSLRGTKAVMQKLRATEDHQTEDEHSGIAQGQGTIGIRGVPSAKSGSFGWQQIIGLEELAETSGSWGSGSGGFGRSSGLPPGMVEVVPRGYDLKPPEAMMFRRKKGPSGYGTRRYLRPENMKPLKKVRN